VGVYATLVVASEDRRPGAEKPGPGHVRCNGVNVVGVVQDLSAEGCFERVSDVVGLKVSTGGGKGCNHSEDEEGFHLSILYNP
jgi:hypothetical protein